MLTISENAQNHFRRLIEQQEMPGLGVRMQAVHAGTPKADCKLEFCEPQDLVAMNGRWTARGSCCTSTPVQWSIWTTHRSITRPMKPAAN